EVFADAVAGSNVLLGSGSGGAVQARLRATRRNASPMIARTSPMSPRSPASVPVKAVPSVLGCEGWVALATIVTDASSDARTDRPDGSAPVAVTVLVTHTCVADNTRSMWKVAVWP